MSANTPIIPPGSPLHGTRADRNSKLIYAVSAVLAVHVVLLAGLLIQGCKKEDQSTGGAQEPQDNSLPALGSAPADNLPSTPPASNPAPSGGITSPPPLPNASKATLPSTPPAVSESAQTSSVSFGPDGTRLPPHSAEVPKVTPAIPGIEGPTVTYTVKAGDNLTKIAKAHGTTPRAIREANGLKTDRILVGKKLKVPQGSVPTAVNERTTPAPVTTKPAGQ